MRLVGVNFRIQEAKIVEQPDLFALGFKDLELHRSSESVIIFCRGFCIFTFAPEDRFSRNYCIVQLHLAGRINLECLSKLFELSYQHCSRILSRFKAHGVEGLKEETHKRFSNRELINSEVSKLITTERCKGTSYEHISEKIQFTFKKRIGAGSIRNWVSKTSAIFERKSSVQIQLEIDVGQESFEVTESQVWNRNVYAGSMILYAMIERSGFLRPFEEYLREDFFKKHTSGSCRRVMLTLFFLHAIRRKNIEQGKHILGKDFCQIIGGSFLRLQPLRYAIDDIVNTEGFDKAIDAYFRDLIKLTEKGDRIYYTDGHFSTYYGKRSVPKGWDPRRQMPYKGRNTVYLHNTAGEIIYFFESATNTVLSNDIEKLVEDVEKLGMELKRKTLIFDRGGYSQRCFYYLKIKKKMYFVTYLKNRKKERQIPEKQFNIYSVKTEDGEKIDYRIFEGERRWARCGAVRVIILLAEDGHQIPILTNNPYLKLETMVFLLSRRWREENCFKYMIQHFGIDLMTTYKTEEAPDKVIKRANPERQAVNREIAKKKVELAKYKNELATKLTSKSVTTTLQQFFEEEKELDLKIKNAQVDIDLLKRKREGIASKIEVNLKDNYVIIAQKRRLFINSIKAMNYNSEKWLQLIFKKYHAKADETLSLIRSLWSHPGRIREDGRLVEVELEPPDLTPMRETLQSVLEELSENNNLRMSDGRLLRISMMRHS